MNIAVTKFILLLVLCIETPSYAKEQLWTDLPPFINLPKESRFGSSVSLQDNYAIISAPYQRQFFQRYALAVGNAFIYNIKTGKWLDLSKTPDSPIKNLSEATIFALSVSLFGNLVLIGAPSHDQNNLINVGNAYIYNIKTGEWLDLSKTPDSPIKQLPKDSRFGYAVSLQGNLALIGAPFQNRNIIKRVNSNITYNTQSIIGNAFIYNIKTGEWLDLSKTPNSPSRYLGNSSFFGKSVTLQGNLALIGAPSFQFEKKMLRRDNAFIYNIKTGEWLDLNKTPNSPIKFLNYYLSFGYSVSLQGNLALIGAPDQDQNNLTDVGNAYIYNIKNGKWIDLSKTPNSPTKLLPEYSNFGRSVSLQGNLALIGAPDQLQSNFLSNGNAFIYNIKTGKWLDLSKTPDSPIKNLSEATIFALSVSLFGNLVLIGAPFHDQNNLINVGNAYIYNINTGKWQDLSENKKKN